MAQNNEKKEETAFTTKSKQFFTGPFLSVIFNISVWTVMGIFFMGVHKTEMQSLKDGFLLFKDELAKQREYIEKIDHNGSQIYQKREKDIIEIKAKVDILENLKLLTEQKVFTVNKDIDTLTFRATRLEDALPKLGLLTQKFEIMEKTQNEMRVDLKELPRIQVQLAELKTLIQQSK